MRKSITVCVPVARRYDLLRELLLSLRDSTIEPSCIDIIDNGRHPEHVATAIDGALPDVAFNVFTPEESLGLAESWNVFALNVPEERLIVNDDVLLGPESLERMTETPGAFVSGLAGTHAFSCFLLRDDCVARVGKFDELISPGYAYFEDLDYFRRMQDVGIGITGVECGVRHGVSKTMEAFNLREMNDHHRKFKIAQANYKAKWGALPEGVVEQL